MTETMDNRDLNALADALSAAWDARVRDGAAVHGGAAEELVALASRLHAADTTPLLTATGRKQIWEEVMAAQAVSGSPQRSPRSLPGANGRAPQQAVTTPAWRPHSPRSMARPNWFLAQFATAALLLLTIGLAYFAFGPGRSAERSSVVPGVLPAGETPAPRAVTAETLAAITLPAGALPNRAGGAFGLYRVPPGTASTWEFTGAAGPRLTYVLAGAYTVQVDAHTLLLRAGADVLLEIPAGEWTVLEAGDALLSHLDDAVSAANRGNVSAELLDGVLYEGIVNSNRNPIPPGWVSQDEDNIWVDTPVPAGAAVLRLQQSTLAANDVLSLPPAGVVQLAVSPDERATLGTQGDFAKRNVGREPITVYTLTLEQAGTESALLAPATATAGEPTIETLVDTTIEALPAGRANVEVDRWRLRPNSTPLTQSALGGTLIFLVETGQITASAAGSEQHLAAGDQVILTGGQTGSFVAAGDAPATALTVALAAGSLEPAKEPWLGSPAYTWDYLMYSSTDGLPGGSGRLLLEQLTLPPGTALPPLAAQPWSWTDVGSGALGLTLDGEKLPFRWKSGAERTFRFSQRLPILQPGTRMTFRNAGDDPLVLYRLTLIPREAPTAGAALPAATPRSP